jgi:hypothetical protein
LIGYEPHGKIFQNTGIIENDQNLWLHPPRSRFFKILELCPFPYVKFASAELEWKDSLRISSNWQDARWAKWEGELKVGLTYANIGYETVETRLGEVRCLVTESTAVSDVGTSFLTTYFHSDLGFVKLEYEILNRYRVLLELVEIKEFGKIQSPQDYIMKKMR